MSSGRLTGCVLRGNVGWVPSKNTQPDCYHRRVRVSESRLAELIGALTLATDAAAGLPPETALRTALIATRVARTARVEGEALRTSS